MNNWIVYILLCRDDSLYTGITNDLERRFEQHKSGKGAKYTKGRSPLKLFYQEVVQDKSAALKRELEIKKMTKDEKLRLCEGV